jgi:hypothetical protein
MALGRRKQETHPESVTGLWEVIDSFTCDLSDGTPVVATRGEVFEEGHELVQRFRAYFIPRAGDVT